MVFWQIWCRCSVVDPLQVVGQPGVNAIVAWSGAALPPADNPKQEHSLLVLRHQGTTAVAFTRVLSALNVSGTKHVLGENHTALLDTLLRPDSRHLQPSQDMRGGPVFTPPSPAAHSVHADGPEFALSQWACWQAGWDGMWCVDDGRS